MRQPIVRAGSACPLFKLAAFGLALAFTLSCSSGGDNGGGGVAYGADVDYQGVTYKTVAYGLTKP